MIEAKGLTKYFGKFRALDRVSFEVRRGEVVGFLGPNGAGKSTTMRILTCFISASSGVAKVHGLDAFDEPLEVRRKLGYLPQRAPLYGEMTVWDYLRFCAEMRGLDLSTFRARMKKIVEVCGLARVLGKDIRTLSHGYRQRVGLGQALVHDPPILILDEPTSDLDPNERAEVIRYIHETGKNRTILLSTHNLNEVEAVCARAIIVSKGRVVADGPLDEIKNVSGKVRYLVSVDSKNVQTAGGYRGAKPPSAQDCQSQLRALPTVSAIRELPADGSAHRFELRGSSKADLRAEIFQLALQKGWILLDLRRESETLEEAFKSLTRDDERADRGRLAREVEEAFSPDVDDEDDDEDEEGEDEEDAERSSADALPQAEEDDADDEDEEDDADEDDDEDEASDEDESDSEEDDDEDEEEEEPPAKPAAKASTSKTDSPSKAEPGAKPQKKDVRS